MWRSFVESLLQKDNERCAAGLLIVAIGLAGTCIFFVGPLYFGDVGPYLAGAYSLVYTGQILDTSGGPFLHWAPLMTVVYAPVYWLQIPVVIWVRLVKCASLIMYAFATVAVLKKLLANTRLASIATVCSLFWSPIFTRFLSMESEPLFLALLALCVYAFVRLLESKEPRWLMLMISTSVVNALLRYSGLFTIAGFAVGIIFFLKHPLKQRMKYAVLYVVGSGMGLMLWFIRNAFFTGAAVDRRALFHPPNFFSVMDQFFSFCVSLTATRGPSFGFVLFVLVAVMCICWYRYARSSMPTMSRSIIAMLTLAAWLYIFLILVTHYYIDLTTTITPRLIVPALYFLYVSSVVVFVFLLKRLNYRTVTAGLILFFGIVVIESAGTMYNLIGLHDLFGRERGLVTALQRVDVFQYGDPVYSNDDEFMFFVTNRYIQPTPYKHDRSHYTDNPTYQNEIDQMIAEVKKGAAIIYIRQYYYEGYQMPLEDLQQLPSLKPVYVSQRVVVFTYAAPQQ